MTPLHILKVTKTSTKAQFNVRSLIEQIMSAPVNNCNLCDFFATERKLFLLAGFYPRRNDKHKCLYFVSAFTNVVISYSQLLTMIFAMVEERNDLFKLSGTLLYCCTHFTFICKLMNFERYKKNILGIEDFLTDSIFNGFSSGQLNIIKGKIRWCDIIAKGYRLGALCLIVTYLIVPFVDTTKKNTLPLPGWFPYDTVNFYTSTYIFQAVSICISGYCNTSIDILTWKLASIAAGQFEILNENLKKIDFKKNYHETRKKLIQCLNHHRKTVYLVKRVQDTFSKGMFLQLFCSVGVICTTGFMMALIPFRSSQFAFLILYFPEMIGQIATYCWYGHEILTTSEKIGRSLYMSNWYECDSGIRKILLIFFENVKDPTLFKAGDFFTLSLTTFTQIMRSAYSYCAVLQKLYNDS